MERLPLDRALTAVLAAQVEGRSRVSLLAALMGNELAGVETFVQATPEPAAEPTAEAAAEAASEPAAEPAVDVAALAPVIPIPRHGHPATVVA